MKRSDRQLYGKWLIQNVYVSEPDVSSPAALASLARIYFRLDRSIYSNFRMWKIRDKWMKLQMQTPDEKGGLTCAICGRKGLKPHGIKKDMLATMDHIKEISEGGSWYDPTNFQVACYHCNHLKDIKHQRNKTLTLQGCVV